MPPRTGIAPAVILGALAVPAVSHAAPINIAVTALPDQCAMNFTYGAGQTSFDPWAVQQVKVGGANPVHDGTIVYNVHTPDFTTPWSNTVDLTPYIGDGVTRTVQGQAAVNNHGYQGYGSSKVVTMTCGAPVPVPTPVPTPEPTPVPAPPAVIVPPVVTPPTPPAPKCVVRSLRVKRHGHKLTANHKVTWIIDGETKGRSRHLTVPKSAHAVLARLSSCAHVKVKQVVFNKAIEGLG